MEQAPELPVLYALKSAAPIDASPHRFRLPASLPPLEPATTCAIAAALGPARVAARASQNRLLDRGSVLQPVTERRCAATTPATAHHPLPTASPRQISFSIPIPSQNNQGRSLNDFENRTEIARSPERQ